MNYLFDSWDSIMFQRNSRDQITSKSKDLSFVENISTKAIRM
jgi:hypothetical protein